MKKLIYLFLVLLLATAPAYAANRYGCTGLTGGASGTLDSLDITGAGAPNADNLADGDSAAVYVISGTNTYVYEYIFDADGTSAESSPDVIRPDDYATQGVWRLSKINSGMVPDLSATYQPLDADLTSIATLGTAADKMAYTTAADTWAETPITAAGRALIDDASASAQRTTLSLVPGTDVETWLNNPTGNDGILKSSSAGTRAWIEKGANNTVLGVNNSGTLGYQSQFRSTDSAAQFSDDTDTTKLFQIVADNITTGTTRTFDTGDYNGQSVAATDVDASGHVNLVQDSDGTGAVQFTGTTLTRAKTVRDAADTLLELGGSYTPTGTWDWSSSTITYRSIVNADISASAAIDWSKIAALTSAHIIVGSAGGVATDVAMSGDVAIDNTGATTIQPNAVDSSMINTIVDSISWDAAGITADGTQCADPAKVTINSGPQQYTIICTDNDTATMYGHVDMPDSWDGGTVTLELEYLQTAADTGALNTDVAMQCRSPGETVSSTWGTEVAIDDAAVTGSNAVDHTTSAAVTPASTTTCAGGDSLWWRVQIDATGTTTAVATLNFLGAKVEYTSNVGD